MTRALESLLMTAAIMLASYAVAVGMNFPVPERSVIYMFASGPVIGYPHYDVPTIHADPKPWKVKP